MLFEILMSLAHPNIYLIGKTWVTSEKWNLYPITYRTNDFLTVIQLFRSYVFFILILCWSPYYGARADRVSKMMSAEISYFFALKCFYKSKPFFFMTMCFAITALPMSYMLQIIEGPALQYINSKKDNFSGIEYSPYESYENCLWNVLVIITTVGYGDYIPESTLGRLLTVFISISGITLVSIFITVLQSKAQFTEHEEFSKKFLQRLNSKTHVKNEAWDYLNKTLSFLTAKNEYVNTYDENRHDVDHFIGKKSSVAPKTNLIVSDKNYYPDIIKKNRKSLNYKKLVSLKNREEQSKKRLYTAFKNKLIQRKRFKDSLKIFKREHDIVEQTSFIRFKLKEIDGRIKSFKHLHEETDRKLDFILEEISNLKILNN